MSAAGTASPRISGHESPGFGDLANCHDRDPDLFFPDRGAATAPAKAICHNCQVREECLEFALTNGERFGIWGGTSERERRRIRRRRLLEAGQASRVGPTAEQEDRVSHLLRSGLAKAEIARRAGVGVSVVRRVAREQPRRAS